MLISPVQIIQDALRLLRVIGEGEDASPRDQLAGWSALQMMLDAWAGDPSMVPDLCDDFLMPGFATMESAVEVPAGSAGLKSMLTYNLAVEIASTFGAVVDPAVAARAASTLSNWRTRVSALHIGRMRHPEWEGCRHYDIREG